MSATAWIVIAIVGFSLAFFALAAAVFMFIKLKIPTVIGDITGRNVIRGVQALRDQKGSSAVQRQSAESAPPDGEPERHDRTAMSYAHVSKRLDVAPDSSAGNSGGTARQGNAARRGGSDAGPGQNGGTVNLSNYYEQQAQEKGTTVLGRSQQAQEKGTTVLNRSQQAQERGTTVLGRSQQAQEKGTTVLGRSQQVQEKGTTVLGRGQQAQEKGTTVLNQSQQAAPGGAPYFNIVKRAVVVHTSETI